MDESVTHGNGHMQIEKVCNIHDRISKHQILQWELETFAFIHERAQISSQRSTWPPSAGKKPVAASDGPR